MVSQDVVAPRLRQVPDMSVYALWFGALAFSEAQLA